MATTNDFADLDLLDQLLHHDGIELRRAPRIPARPPGDRAALSYQQQRLWFLHELEPASASFNVSGAVALRGALDVEALAWALDQVVSRHEALRTTFGATSGAPWQRIAPPTPGAVPLARGDLTALADDALDAAIRTATAAETARPFDLERGPLIRARLLSCRARHHVLIVTIHHIVCDGWSVGVFLAELAHHYLRRHHRAAQLPPLPPLDVSYADYAHWQRQTLTPERLATQLAYWTEQLAALPPIWLPWDRARADRAEPMIAGSVMSQLDANTTLALRRIAGERDTTLATALLAGFQAVLHRYSGQTDFAIGLASSHRSAPELEGLIGFFVQLLVIRADLDGAPSFTRLIERARDATVAAMAHADVPFETLVDRLSPDRHMNRHPLFQVSFVFQNLPDHAFELPGLTLERIGADQTARFDLELFLTESSGAVQINWVYDARLFDAATIAGMADAYACLLAEAAAAPDVAIDQLRLVPTATARAWLTAREQARLAFPTAPCLHEMFSATAARFPRRTALIDGLERWRYDELEAAANRLAHRLIAAGVQPGALVGLYRRRSADLVISLLAILKAGAAYVPIDPNYPEERVRFILADSGVALVVTDSDAALPMAERGDAVLALAPEATPGSTADTPWDAPPSVAVTPDHVAYVIYTSGSTGTPKGCPIRHRNVTRLMRATEAWFGFDEKDAWTLFHSTAFDFSVWEIWGAWCYGGRLVVVPYDTSRDPAAFYDLLCAQRVTVLNQTPSAFKALIDVDGREQRDAELALRYVIFGGEALDPADLRPWFARHGDDRPRLINMYGITETTVHVTYRPLRADDACAGSTIGVPIPDLAIHLLDPGGAPVPAGAIGEIYVSGAGVAHGYLDRDDLTRERFVASPLGGGERWYRTGDLARRLGSGDLEYRGRIDHQVKIRGFRIELDEIRACIQAVPAVRDSLVTLDTSTGDARLIAYVIPDTAQLTTREQLRRVAEDQVRDWRDTFETTYRGANPTGVEDFNTVGWRDSHRGAQIPDREMRAWLDDTLAAIRALAPRRVLEIGCGTGMLLLDLAPSCEAYVGLDFSAATLDTLAGAVARRGLGQVELHHRAAHELAVLDGRRFDTIVLNSVIQYFPDRDYLLGVLRACAALLAPGGTIFVGDVRNLALLDAYHADIAWRRAAPDTARAALADRVRASVREEEELVLDPAFFAGLAGELDGVRAVVTSAKPGAAANELNKYRYDVFLCREALTAAQRARLYRAPAAEVLRSLGEDAAILDWLAGRRDAARAGDLDVSTAAARPGPLLHPLHTAPGPRWNQPALAHAVRLLVTDIRAQLRRVLPDYMIPAHIMPLAAFPVTAHGKLDRAALPVPHSERPAAAERFIAPEPGIEAQLAEVWCQVLNVERVGRHDSFFAVGGHSLLATQLITWINERFATHQPLRAVFEHPTLAAFARLLDEPAAPGTAAASPAIATTSPIRRRLDAGPAPLAFGQQRLWFLDQMAPGQATYHTAQAIDVHGPLDLDALEAALAAVIARHAILRTHIELIGDEPRQIVHERVAFALDRRTGTYLPDGSPGEAVRRALAEETSRPFTLDRAPLVRATVFSQGDSRHTVLLVVHHIAIDGWSLGVLVRELDACYMAQRRGAVPALAALPIQYADYAAFQRDWLASPAAAEQRAYWLGALAAPPARCTLPHDPPRRDVDRAAGATVTRPLGPGLSAALAAYCATHHTTPFALLATALFTVLHRVTGRDDLVIGAPTAQRNHRELEPLIGFFVNTLVLRARPRADHTFDQFADEVRRTVIDAQANQDYPFELLVKELVTDRDGTQNPLFEVMLVVQNQSMSVPAWDGTRCSVAEIAPTAAKFDLTVFAGETADGLVLTAEYRVASYREATIRACLDALASVLQQALHRPASRLAELAHAPAPGLTAEHERICVAWNATERAYPEVCVHTQFAAQAARTPEAVAVRYEDQVLSYAELDTKAERLARYLVDAGVTRGARVGIYLSRTPELVIAVLGVLKAGGAYVPLEPKLPRERLGYMMQDAGIGWAVLEAATMNELPLHGVDVIVMDGAATDEAWLEAYAEGGLPSVAMTDLAYVIYTSGSTGQPKGVMVEHRGLANYLAHAVESYLPALAGSVVSSPLCFDATLTTLLPPLLVGKPVWLLRDDAHTLGQLADRLFAAGEGWLFKITPAHLDVLAHLERGVASGQAEHCIVVGGEQLTSATLQRWKGELLPRARFVNEYGPTETVVGCSTWTLATDEQLAELARSTAAPIGRPIGNTQLYVLGADLQVQPVGTVGELYIGGAGVARGYLNRAELTQERFVANPFGPGRLYRTGDRVRYVADRELEFVGRIDDQVKIRGFRVEPGEIAAQLVRQPGVREAAVVAREDQPGDKRLVAYVVASDGAGPEAQVLREALAQVLPDYMVPAAYVVLDALPLTSNGKLDRRALPVPDHCALPAPTGAAAGAANDAPRTPLEWQLCLCFERVLQRYPVGIDQSFFALGGHSFLALRLVSEIGRALGCRVPVARVFTHPTVRTLAQTLDGADPLPAHAGLVPLRTGGARPPLYLIHQAGGYVVSYFALARRLPDDRPIYGLQPPGLDGAEPPLTTIDALARHHLAAIRTVQPHGPYHLAGHSLGGAIAYEMARQLVAAGEPVAYLGLIDSHLPSGDPDEPDPRHAFAYLIEQIEALFGQPLCVEVPPDAEPGAWITATARALAHAGIADAATAAQHVAGLYQVFGASVTAFRSYRAEPCAVAAAIYQTAALAQTLAARPDLAWDRRARGTVVHHDIPGEHLDLLQEPHVAALAIAMAGALASASATDVGRPG